MTDEVVQENADTKTAEPDRGGSPTALGESRMGKRIRMTVDFPPKTAERLERLKEATGAASYAEVLRNALALFEILTEAQERGARLVVEEQSGEKEAVRWAQ